MTERRARPKDIVCGVRVRRTPPQGQQRIGLVTHDLPVGRDMVDVIPEGCSTGRAEAWPLSQLTLLPKSQQLVRHGGSFAPPKGYPFLFPATPGETPPC